MKQHLALVAFAVGLLLVASGAAQCPKIRLDGRSDSRNMGEPVTIMADLSAGDAKVEPKYTWAVSAGKIAKGQGTFMIEVDTTDLGNSLTLTATVEINGFAKECSATGSFTTDFKKKGVSVKVDEFSGLKQRDEEARLNKISEQLTEDRFSTVYVFAYTSKKSKAGDATAALSRIREYLYSVRGVDYSRIGTLEGGERKAESIEIWIGGEGAAPPVATPAKP